MHWPHSWKQWRRLCHELVLVPWALWYNIKQALYILLFPKKFLEAQMKRRAIQQRETSSKPHIQLLEKPGNGRYFWLQFHFFTYNLHRYLHPCILKKNKDHLNFLVTVASVDNVVCFNAYNAINFQM